MSPTFKKNINTDKPVMADYGFLKRHWPIILLPFCLLFCSACATVKTIDLATSGRYQELEKHAEETAGDSAKASSGDLYNLCFTYSSTRNFSKLLKCTDDLQSRIDQGDRGGLLNVTPAPYWLRASAYFETGELRRAITEATKAKELAEGIATGLLGDRTTVIFTRLMSLSIVGLSQAMLGDTQNAEATIKEMMSIDARTQTEFRSIMVARILVILGKYRKAMDVLVERANTHSALKGHGAITPAYTLFLEEIESDKPLNGSFLNPIAMKVPQMFMISKLHYMLGDPDKATKGYNKLISVPDLKQQGLWAWMIYYDAGRIAYDKGDLETAIGYFRSAIEIIEQQRSTIEQEQGKIGFVGDKQDAYLRMIVALTRLGRSEEAFEYVERSKSRALVDLLASRKDIQYVKNDQTEFRTLLNKLGEAERLAALPSQGEAGAQQRGVVVKIRQEINAASPQLSSLVTVSGLRAKEIQSLLSENELLLEYYSHGDFLCAFLVSRNSIKSVPLDAKGLAEDVAAFRRGIAEKRGDLNRGPGLLLYKRLIGPLAEDLKTERLLIVPHGNLHYLPFSALSDGKEYLVDRFSIRMLPSASVLTFLKERTKQEDRGALIFGNPKLNDPKYDLKFAQDEALAIGRIMPKSNVLLRGDASKTNLQRLGGRYSVIHLAAHGVFDPDKPLDSALLLAADGNNDGLLSSADLYRLTLSADLVTLSACDTALGKVATGDDVVGFTRGFLYAGARSLISSLWQVDDEATRDLMIIFYTNLSEMSKDESLRQAQLVTKKKYAHPYYWAAFLLTGKGK